MSQIYDIQRRLDAQLDRSNNEVQSLVKNMQGNQPSMDDLFTFKNALRKEAVANIADNQLTSLKHNLSKQIIDSIS